MLVYRPMNAAGIRPHWPPVAGGAQLGHKAVGSQGGRATREWRRLQHKNHWALQGGGVRRPKPAGGFASHSGVAAAMRIRSSRGSSAGLRLCIAVAALGLVLLPPLVTGALRTTQGVDAARPRDSASNQVEELHPDLRASGQRMIRSQRMACCTAREHRAAHAGAEQNLSK